MVRPILFVQGAGAMWGPDGSGGLVEFLREQLGAGYEVRAPEMPSPDDPRYERWRGSVVAELERVGDSALLVGHSLGGSVLLKCLAEGAYRGRVAGLFLVATPFWGRDESWKLAWALPEDFAERLPPIASAFLYHSREDPEAPFASVELYREHLPHATVRTLDGNDHSFTRGLPSLVDDIRTTASVP